MPDPIAPALTAEEWARMLTPIDKYGNRGGCFRDTSVFFWFNNDGFDAHNITGYDGETSNYPPEARHALASLALYGQPYGFTREDVSALHEDICVQQLSRQAMGREWPIEFVARMERLGSLLQRIEALLPPEAYIPTNPELTVVLNKEIEER